MSSQQQQQQQKLELKLVGSQTSRPTNKVAPTSSAQNSHMPPGSLSRQQFNVTPKRKNSNHAVASTATNAAGSSNHKTSNNSLNTQMNNRLQQRSSFLNPNAVNSHSNNNNHHNNNQQNTQQQPRLSKKTSHAGTSASTSQLPASGSFSHEKMNAVLRHNQMRNKLASQNGGNGNTGNSSGTHNNNNNNNNNNMHLAHKSQILKHYQQAHQQQSTNITKQSETSFSQLDISITSPQNTSKLHYNHNIQQQQPDIARMKNSFLLKNSNSGTAIGIQTPISATAALNNKHTQNTGTASSSSFLRRQPQDQHQVYNNQLGSNQPSSKLLLTEQDPQQKHGSGSVSASNSFLARHKTNPNTNNYQSSMLVSYQQQSTTPRSITANPISQSSTTTSQQSTTVTSSSYATNFTNNLYHNQNRSPNQQQNLSNSFLKDVSPSNPSRAGKLPSQRNSHKQTNISSNITQTTNNNNNNVNNYTHNQGSNSSSSTNNMTNNTTLFPHSMMQSSQSKSPKSTSSQQSSAHVLPVQSSLIVQSLERPSTHNPSGSVVGMPISNFFSAHLGRKKNFSTAADCYSSTDQTSAILLTKPQFSSQQQQYQLSSQVQQQQSSLASWGAGGMNSSSNYDSKQQMPQLHAATSGEGESVVDTWMLMMDDENNTSSYAKIRSNSQMPINMTSVLDNTHITNNNNNNINNNNYNNNEGNYSSGINGNSGIHGGNNGTSGIGATALSGGLGLGQNDSDFLMNPNEEESLFLNQTSFLNLTNIPSSTSNQNQQQSLQQQQSQQQALKFATFSNNTSQIFENGMNPQQLMSLGTQNTHSIYGFQYPSQQSQQQSMQQPNSSSSSLLHQQSQSQHLQSIQIFDQQTSNNLNTTNGLGVVNSSHNISNITTWGSSGGGGGTGYPQTNTFNNSICANSMLNNTLNNILSNMNSTSQSVQNPTQQQQQQQLISQQSHSYQQQQQVNSSQFSYHHRSGNSATGVGQILGSASPRAPSSFSGFIGTSWIPAVAIEGNGSANRLQLDGTPKLAEKGSEPSNEAVRCMELKSTLYDQILPSIRPISRQFKLFAEFNNNTTIASAISAVAAAAVVLPVNNSLSDLNQQVVRAAGLTGNMQSEQNSSAFAAASAVAAAIEQKHNSSFHNQSMSQQNNSIVIGGQQYDAQNTSMNHNSSNYYNNAIETSPNHSMTLYQNTSNYNHNSFQQTSFGNTIQLNNNNNNNNNNTHNSNTNNNSNNNAHLYDYNFSFSNCVNEPKKPQFAELIPDNLGCLEEHMLIMQQHHNNTYAEQQSSCEESPEKPAINIIVSEQLSASSGDVYALKQAELNSQFQQQQSQSQYSQNTTNNAIATTNSANNHSKTNGQKINPSMISYDSYFIKGNSIIDAFQIGKCLGRGRFGNVYLCRHKASNGVFAIKQINKKSLLESCMEKQLQQEIKIQMYLKHPNVLHMHGFFSDAQKVYLLLELASHGDIYKEIKREASKRFSEEKAANYIRQICEGLIYLHSQGIIHRDIKPENILNSYGVLKLSDFGWSIYTEEKRMTFCGTLDYVSPEVVSGKQYDFKVDIWSIGVLTYELLTGKPPFENRVNHNEAYQKILMVKYEFPEYLSLESQDFMSKLLVGDPNKRISLEDALNHKWILSNTHDCLSDWEPAVSEETLYLLK